MNAQTFAGPLARRALLVVLAATLAVNAFTLWHGSRYGLFQCDDFQHAHLAWQTLQGKLVHRDVFDNHGPLSAWVNALVLGLGGARAVSFDGILLLRTFVLTVTFAQAGLVHLLTRRMGAGRLEGLLAASLFTSSHLLLETGTMNRPDSLQNLLLLVAVWWASGGRPFRAGIAAGLGLLLLFKGVLGAGALGAGIAFVAWREHRAAGDTPTFGWLRAPGWYLAGITAAMLPVVVFYAVNHGGAALWEGLVAYNFRETATRVGTERAVIEVTRLRFWRWFTKDIVFALLGLAGLVKALAGTVTPTPPTRTGILGAIVGLGVLPTWLMPLYPEVCLVTLPFLAILAVGLSPSTPTAARRLVMGLLLLSAVAASGQRFLERPTPERAAGREKKFREELDWVLSSSARTTPVLYFWASHSPAHIFNDDPDRRWMLPADEKGGPFNSIVDSEHLETARRLVRERLMPGGDIDWVVVDPNNFKMMDHELRHYLETAFERRHDVFHRKSGAAATTGGHP